MSDNNQTKPAEILDIIAKLPKSCRKMTGKTPLDRAAAFLSGTDKGALISRFFIYRFDVTGGKNMGSADAYQASLVDATDTPLHRACAAMNADLQLIELGAGAHTGDDAARACAHGMMATEEGTGLVMALGFGAGDAPDTPYEDATGFLNNATPEMAALFGVMASCARANIPFIGEGARCAIAAHALYNLRPDLCDGIFLTDTCGIDVPVTTFNDLAHASGMDGLSGAMLGAVIQNLSLAMDGRADADVKAA